MSKESNKKKMTACEQYTQINDIGKASIHMLNNDCLSHIFLFLPIIDRVRIERVCKRWRDLSQNSWYAMKRLDLLQSTWGSTQDIDDNMFHKTLLKCGRFLTQIELSNPIHCLNTKSTLISMGRLCTNLTHIDISSLEIPLEIPFNIDSTVAHYFKNRRQLFIEFCDEELKNLFKLNQNLKYFAISTSYVKGRSLLYLPEQMHTITLKSCHRVHDDSFPMALQRLENLKHLTIDKCRSDTVIAKRTLEVLGKHCKNLTVLELNAVYFFVEETDMLHLIYLINLQVLKVTYNNNITDKFLANLVKRCQQLVSLDITGCRSISNKGLNAIAALLKLEKLTISQINTITDYGLNNICDLKELECRKCVHFTDQGISMFIKSSPQLQLIDLSGCPDITEIILEVANNACDTRSNNVMLKMIVGGTSIDLNREICEVELSPLLKIVNEDYSQTRSEKNIYNHELDNGVHFDTLWNVYLTFIRFENRA